MIPTHNKQPVKLESRLVWIPTHNKQQEIRIKQKNPTGTGNHNT